MKMKYINTELLLETWKAGVKNLLFPGDLIAKIKPDAILDQWGDELPGEREKTPGRC